MKRARMHVDHGGWSHAGKQTKRCLACRAGIGSLVIPLKPMKMRNKKSKEKTK